jgi:NAD(P)H-nitrite reductase large subunit
VQWILSGERPWHPVAGDAAGRWVASLMTDRGVEVVPNTQVRELLGDGRVQRVVLDDGSQVGCDFVVAAVGARVDSRPVAGTRITMGRAVVCDGLGRTGAQGIWAAGDCAVIADDRLDGKPAGAAHWEVAHAQGVHVGTNAARVVTGQDPLPWAGLPGWHSELFGLDVIAWGHARPIDRRVVRGNPSVASPNFAELGIDADGRICHAIIVGRAPERAAIRQLVDTRRPVAEMEERLRNPSTPLD